MSRQAPRPPCPRQCFLVASAALVLFAGGSLYAGHRHHTPSHPAPHKPPVNAATVLEPDCLDCPQ